MLNISDLLEQIKKTPYREITVSTPHTGVVSFAPIKAGDKVTGPSGQWKEKPGTRLATLTRERNEKAICAPENGVVGEVRTDFEGAFVECGCPLVTIRHHLTREEVEGIILRQALFLFRAPERAKYYFAPEVAAKIRASEPGSVVVREGQELFIMSRMKREVPLYYSGPEGVIYATYIKHNDNVDAGEPLIGVCPGEALSGVKEVIVRVQTEWNETI